MLYLLRIYGPTRSIASLVCGKNETCRGNLHKSSGSVGSSDDADSPHIGVSDAHIDPESTQATACPNCGGQVRRFTSRTKHGTLWLHVSPGCERQWSRKGKATDAWPSQAASITRERVVQVFCELCGAVIVARRVDAKFCSDYCRNKNYRLKHPRRGTKEDTLG